ncbi:MAG: hypothetical protein GXW90_08845 [Tepidanaerobacter acetatoxydans]|nr:hypothetical protein [Tepidanaerobacter acetatoxydans]
MYSLDKCRITLAGIPTAKEYYDIINKERIAVEPEKSRPSFPACSFRSIAIFPIEQ